MCFLTFNNWKGIITDICVGQWPLKLNKCGTETNCTVKLHHVQMDFNRKSLQCCVKMEKNRGHNLDTVLWMCVFSRHCKK